jgi:CDP-L-myo-inositol myo-inositolphosphotransferase
MRNRSPRLVRTCLIIAAGQGTRLRPRGDVKPLVPLLGVSLIERVIRSAMESGLEEFCVVTGYQGERVAEFLRRLSQRLGVAIDVIHNDEWRQENGLSVARGRAAIHEPFILLMADHLFDPRIIEALRQQSIADADVVLAVDPVVDGPLIDIDDATKVSVEDGYITAIGKNLTAYDAIDTGIFLCTPAVFSAVDHVRGTDRHGQTALSAAIQLLADRHRARALAVREFWIDVDDGRAYKRAERALLDSLRSKRTDGPVSRWLNRPISARLSSLLVRTPVTPNEISFSAFVLALISSALFAAGGYRRLALGGVIAQSASVLDGSDGEVARLKYLSSDFGRWFDAVLDRYADAMLLFGLTWHAYRRKASPWVVPIGFLAVVGSFMVSYTADKHDSLMENRATSGLRVGRDVRILVISAGALANQPFWTLCFVAALMNGEAVRRVVVCRHA